MIPQGVRLQEPQGTCRRCRDTLIAAQHRRRSCAPLPGARPCSREKEGKDKDMVSFANFATFYLYSACRLQVRTVKKRIESGRIHSVPKNNQTQAKGRQTREPLHGLPKSAFLLRDQEGNTLKDYPEPGRGNSRREPCRHPPRGPPGTGSDTIRKQPEKDSRTTDVIQEKTPSMTSKWEVNFC